ncbi:Putative E3 ubiquitin-protein ligase Zswim2 [Septoria linicola]|uniref:E3 ubiquitin-protein ligase Zswim2 n=1 Tax=Septoria linicola TaxID=215465 RepID=A0A9Q9B5V3_9PEZI|nr:Putative E3 ubiquitin-protein ligase Zswim2 [Septoria linicola]
MAVEDAPRRSARARKLIKTFAEEQAEAAAFAASQPARKTPKKRKATKKKSAARNGGQPYGAPAEGTMIPWLPGRTRKQPKVWEVKAPEYTKKANWHADAAERRGEARLEAIPKLAEGQEEVRLESDLDAESDKHQRAREKALTQKMFVLERDRTIEQNCHARHDDCPCEELLIAGSKGNVYTVRISHIVTCNCPVSIFEKKGSEGHCKHILYALHTVLRIPDHLQNRQSFLHSELKELFANSPALPSQVAEHSEKDGNRKDADGECPICFMDFEEGEDLVWCKAACGNNLHAQCFRQWENNKNPVTCPFCRTRWQDNTKGKGQQKASMAEVDMPMDRGMGGYYNVADQLPY